MPVYPITPESVGEFIDKTNNEILKLKEFNYQQLVERINMIEIKRESERAIINEKNENLLYRLTILTEKCNSVEQKVNDLNKIMMKHFAYKTNKSDSETVTKNKINLPLPPTPLIPTTQPFKFT
jgi:hypothetical protein